MNLILSLDALDFNVSEIGCNYTQTIPSFDTQVQILSNVAKIFVVLHSYFLWNSPVNQYSYDYKIWNSFVNTNLRFKSLEYGKISIQHNFHHWHTFPSVEKLSWNKNDKQSIRSIPRACKIKFIMDTCTQNCQQEIMC